MLSAKRRHALALLLVGAVLTASVQMVVALVGGQGPPVGGGYTSDGSISGAELVRVQRRSTPAVRSSTSYSTLGTVFVPLPAFSHRFLVIRFSGESACYATTPNETNPQWCRVRVLVNGVETSPLETGVHTFAFDSTDGGTTFGAPHDDVSEGPSSWESHSIDRTICVQNSTDAPANAEVKLQWAVTSTNVEFWLDDWSLIAESWINCQSTF
jgi:hypothetical protein